MKRKILIIDDEPDTGWIFSRVLEDSNYEVSVARTGEEGIAKIRKELPALVFLDIKLPKMDGIETLRQIRMTNNDLLVIMLTAHETVKTAVETMKLGAYDYLTKPIPNHRLKIIIEHAFQTHSLSLEVSLLKTELQKEWNVDSIIGNCLGMQGVINSIKKVASYDITVLIRGESGTGKELVARAIHYVSPRADKPFAAVDCTTLPEALVESELFGYEKGAFTGAEERKEGKFEQANGGTLFLDEITNLPNSIQMKILRAVQERKFQHLGGKKDITVDVRIIVATNISLSEAVKTGKFRDDLFYRLNEFHIDLPPLRERKEDMPVLTKYFLDEANRDLNRKAKNFSGEAMRFLLDYHWPGNVRELKNVIRRAVLLADSKEITLCCLSLNNGSQPAQSQLQPQVPIPGPKEGASLREMKKKSAGQIEEKMIKEAMVKAGGNKTKAARILKIDRATLYSKIKEFQIK